MQNKSILHILFFGLIATLWISCSEKAISPDNNRLGLEYFPLEIGQYRIYDVDEILYSISSFDTLKYELKETVVSSFENAEGGTTYTIHREKRNTGQETWKLDSVWSARKTNALAVSVENNISFVKMVFPVKNDLRWDGNVMNSLAEKQYVYDMNLEKMTFSEQEFSDLVKVIQSDVEENIVNRDERHEIYAKEVGLVEKYGMSLMYCTVDCPSQKTIVSGRFIQQTLTSYGQE